VLISLRVWFLTNVVESLSVPGCNDEAAGNGGRL